jgi:hypothetical protein
MQSEFFHFPLLPRGIHFFFRRVRMMMIGRFLSLFFRTILSILLMFIAMVLAPSVDRRKNRVFATILYSLLISIDRSFVFIK